MACVRFFHNVVLRKLVYNQEEAEDSNLRRCLGRWDLTSLGLGSTLGVGVYVLVGAVALKFAGPSVVLSFLIAAVAAIFAGLCFAEFGARVPRAGSAYVYTYVTIGELVAFIIGWNVILEGFFGTASVAKGLSNYIDSMADGVLSEWFTRVFPMPDSWFSNYFDLVSFCIVILLGSLLAIGARESTTVNNVFSLLNMAVIMFVIVAGSFTAQVSNWSIPASEVPEGKGTGGFFPYGAWGTLQGAALCFYGFTGFDAISATGEEVRDPRKTIPHAIIIVLCIVFIVYASVSTVITMMMPYYLLDKVAATALAFKYVGWNWARWVVSCGAVAGIFASLFGSLFPVTRLLYAMASDGLILRCFGYVSHTKKTPVVATLVSTAVVALLASTMELEDLILMMAVGTLSSYTIVATCVIILRYHSATAETKGGYLKQMLGIGSKEASPVSARIVNITLFLYTVVCLVTAVLDVHVRNLVGVVVGNVLVLLLLIVITLQPKAHEHLTFKTPLVPVIPCLSIYINIHLMVFVNIKTWIRVSVWLAIGIPVYFIGLCCCKRPESNFVKPQTDHDDHSKKNGTPPVQIVVESPTPPDTLSKSTTVRGEHPDDKITDIRQENAFKHPITPFIADEIIVQQAFIENNEEKEAKIIDLLDQVLQAEEDSYIEQISLREEIPEDEIMTPIETTESIPHRKSLSELSDAGSDASLSTQDTKYNVIAQVHREDLPKVSEEEEKADHEVKQLDNINDSTNETSDGNIDEHEQVTSFNNDSETNSRTDESGYSDTLDRNILNDSTEEVQIQEEVPRIPTPPPMDETYFSSPYVFKKAYTISVHPNRPMSVEQNEEEKENKPRESVQSNTSHGTDDGNIVFGSSRQMKFMNKLNDIFQHKIATDDDGNHAGEEQRKRSNSTGDVENVEMNPKLIYDRPAIFFDLKKELAAISVPNLRPVRHDDAEKLNKTEPIMTDEDDATTEDSTMSRENLKSKLETIFATGGPKLIKPRLMKSNPPTPEEAYQTDASSTESIPKTPKIEKNDTLKRQKDKFGAVLNSFRLSLNKDDAV